MMKIRCIAVLLAVSYCLGGCSTLFEQEQPSSSVSSSGRQKIKVISGTPSRGADLEPVEGEGHLVEPSTSDESTPSGDDNTSVPETPLRWDLNLLPYRAMLNETEQLVYDEIYSQLMGMNNFFVLRRYASAERIDDIIHAVLYDNPELFWVDSKYRYSYTQDGKVGDITVTFNTLSSNIVEAREKFEAAANALVTAAESLPTDMEKEKLVHDAIVGKVDYKLGAAQNQSAYSALVTNRSVCAGYSRAFQYVMMELGIPCYYCVGFAGEDHAWNIIRLGDEYYNVDLSWDDPVGSAQGEIHYEYYNITDEKLFFDHRREELSVNLPACNATEYSYNSTFGRQSPAKEGGAPQDMYDLGYTDDDVIMDLEEYYAESSRAVAEQGAGEVTCAMVLHNEALREQVYQVISDQTWFQGIVAPAATNLDLKGYTAEISVTYEELKNGYLLLTQKITLTPT